MMTVTNNVAVTIFLIVVVILSLVWLYDYNVKNGLKFLKNQDFYGNSIDRIR